MRMYPPFLRQVLRRAFSACSLVGVLAVMDVLAIGRWPCLPSGKLLPALAQIRPDDFLGDTPSTVSTDSSTGQQLIDGGATRGTTLFHSFKTFSIEPDGNAYFVNPDVIDLIVSRVTGNRASNLLGTLGVLGNADVFFINPNGITFGPNSTLELNGSFVASTADSLMFGDEFSFSASTPNNPPLLTVTTPTGLGFQQPSPIRYDAERAFGSLGLTVPKERTLALVGGELSFQGANLLATRGRIEIGSVSDSGAVHVTPSPQGWELDYGDIASFGDFTANASFISAETETEPRLVTSNIQGEGIFVNASDISLNAITLMLSNTSTDVSASDITITARNLTLSGGSQMSSRAVAGEEDISGDAGNIMINASESVTIDGAADLGLFISPTGLGSAIEGEFPRFPDGVITGVASGQGGDIQINAPRVSVTRGAGLFSRTFSRGDAGDITINAPEHVEVSGLFTLEDAITSASIDSQTGAAGAGGTISINTGRLVVKDGADLTARSFGSGNGGSIELNADVVNIAGHVVALDAVTLEEVEVVSSVTSSTAETGQAGQVVINTQQLLVQNGGQVTTATQSGSQGDGNLLAISATDRIEIRGRTEAGSASGLFSSTEGEGRAGQVQIATDELRIEAGGIVSAATLVSDSEALEATSDASERSNRIVARMITPANIIATDQRSSGLALQVNRLILDNGNLSVETFAQDGSGADINISDLDLLVLSNDSLLSAEALNSANGGNIRLDASDGFVVAPVDTDSDILARANQGNGGEIEIVARSIFGLEERLAIPDNGTNDIDASSRFGASGTVSLNQLEVNPVPEAAELSERPETPEVSQACNPSQQVSSLVLTGRGGIPPEPWAVVPGLLWHPSGDTAEQAVSLPDPSISVLPMPDLPISDLPILVQGDRPILEAQGWQRNESGQIVLSARHPVPVPQAPNGLLHCTLHS